MKIDMHVHTSGVSKCAIANYKEVILKKISQGYDGMVITNHIQSWYCDINHYPILINSHIQEYNDMVEFAKQYNFLIIFSVEVTIEKPELSDFILYGMTPELLQHSPILYLMTQESLYRYCKAYNILMVQAHPFRIMHGHRLQDVNLMDGIELNANTDLAYKDQIFSIAKNNKLIVTCGTDYHGGNSNFAGQILPNYINTPELLYNYLKNSKQFKIFVGEKSYTIER